MGPRDPEPAYANEKRELSERLMQVLSDAADPRVIRSIRGVGYLLTEIRRE